ncbi:MAG TPA: hypothetical protein VE954_11450, partial [Oligoflexus sp.]
MHRGNFFILMWILGSIPMQAQTGAALPTSSTTVQLVANEWCPQHCEKNHEHKGYIIEIVVAAFAAEGITTQISYMPWLRAMHEVKKGNFDGLLTP